MPNYALTASCKSTIGIVAAISTFLAQNECNITDSAQFDDPTTGTFFTRVSFKSVEPLKLALSEQNWLRRAGHPLSFGG